MSFFRRKKNTEPAPEWTPFQSYSDYEEFISHVKKYFDRRKLTYTIEDEAIRVADEEWPVGLMGLSNLAQVCNQNPRSAWKSIVTDHFEGLERAKEFESAFFKKAHDYSHAAPYIGVRVYPNDYIAHVGEEAIIKKPIAEDLSAILVFDFPNEVINLKPETTIQWNKTNEQLYEIGMANIRINYSNEITSEDIEGSRIWIIQGDHFFVNNSVLDLQPVPTGTHGSLVGIPHRHAVLVYPIEDLGMIKTLPALVYVLQGMYREGPGSISQSLYWHREGNLVNLPYRLEETEFHFTPPEKFLDMMNTLQEKK